MMRSDVKKVGFKKSHIRRQFDRSAARYEQVASMQKTIANDLMKHSSLNLQSGNILDAGCGTGYGLEILMKAYPDAIFTGLDLAPRMLDVAQKKYSQVTFKQGDIEQLPFDDNVFDLTWSSSAIQWCNTNKSVAELVRVTRPEGLVLLSTFTRGTLQSWRKLWSLESGKRFALPEEVGAAFAEAGLNKVRVITKTYIETFSSFNGAVSSIRDLGAGNAEENRSRGLFGVERYKAIKADIENKISVDGKLELPYFVTFVIAEKA